MAIVLQASLGAAPSPAKSDDTNVQQLKNRIRELEQETEELSRKYNEELKTERVNNCAWNLVEGSLFQALRCLHRVLRARAPARKLMQSSEQVNNIAQITAQK